MKIERELFRVSGDPDGQLLLALVLVLGTSPGVTAWDLWERVRYPRPNLHPSIDAEWRNHFDVARGLGRLRRRGLARGGPLDYGEPSVWRPTKRGLEWLADHLLLEPTGAERRARNRSNSAER